MGTIVEKGTDPFPTARQQRVCPLAGSRPGQVT
jgi:hypothetical protein